MRSLYLHFPFCETKCHYCDFYSIGRERTREDDASQFEQALVREIHLRTFAPEIETIFLGGGTPSMTPPSSMERIFSALFQKTKLAPQAEWTMEANPSSISLENFRAYRELGINRVSMGVQSLRNDHLSKLGRVHDEGAALRALETVFNSGFTNVSTDLLCGVPGQSLSDLEDHLTRLTSFPIQHLSIYLLTLPKHHKMYSELPSDDEQLRHLLFIDSFMKDRGFQHYEISNFCRPGMQARHNLVYWTGGSYLGLGPSAHSYDAVKKTRFKNVSSLHAYAQHLEQDRLPVEWTEHLTSEQLELEKWMLAIRLDEGFAKDWLQAPYQKTKAQTLMTEGLLEPHPQHPDRLRATARGFALSDALVRELS